jgi:hypothetical protein
VKINRCTFEAQLRDADGDWVRITLKGSHADGTFTARVTIQHTDVVDHQITGRLSRWCWRGDDKLPRGRETIIFVEGALLVAALGFLRYPPRTRALTALHQWLDNWSGIGLIVVGMERQGYQFSLRKYGNRDGAWVAQFNGDVATSADGFGSGSTPWKARSTLRGMR